MEAIFIILSVFAGVSSVIAVSGWVKTEHLRAARRSGKESERTATAADPVLVELRALKQQIDSMQATSHQFDLSFDEALTRLEQRVGRLETKSAAAPVDAPNVIRNGHQG